MNRKVFFTLFIISSFYSVLFAQLVGGIPLDGGECSAVIKFNNQPLSLSQKEVNSNAHNLSFYAQTNGYCILLKAVNQVDWVTIPNSNNINGTFSLNIQANNTPNERVALIYLTDYNDKTITAFAIRQNGNTSLVAYYFDSDQDGFGDYNAEITYSASPLGVNYSTNNKDVCPNEYSTTNDRCLDSAEDQNLNWRKSYTYDRDGVLIGASKGYFNDLGKSIQTQTYDAQTRKVWATETLYDLQGSSAVQTMSAPITDRLNQASFGYKLGFMQTNVSGLTGFFSNSDFEKEDIENPTPLGNQKYSLGWYYSNQNNSEPLQDITTRPYSRTIYSDLMPDEVKKTIGGNKMNDEWKQGYSFTMPAPQELYYIYGYNYFPNNPPVAATYGDVDLSKRIMWLKATKTVVEDVHGNESVVFIDSDGKTLGAARSGWNNNSRTRTTAPKRYDILSLIGEQKYIDIHIPAGCENTLRFLNGANNYKVYNLKTESEITSTLTTLGKGFYRIEYIGNKTLTKSSNLTYIKSDGTIASLNNASDVFGVRYQVNYYDFSINEYDKTERLIATLQPIGFNDACFDGNTIKANVNHTATLKSTFKYNVLGQLVSSTSPDEGTANFKYRHDGQIRFSQNSKQLAANEFSYTNYDELGRPFESGVCRGSFSTQNPDGANNFSGTRKEQHHTQYDFLGQTDLNYLAAVHSSYANPSFLASNIAKTWNNNSATYYSYDVYGRVQWIVQKTNIGGLEKAVTIDYEYDPVTSQVLKVDFQKYVPGERFVHRYTYDTDSQELVNVATSTNGTNFTTHADYEYYETGAMKRTVIAGGLQGIDYVYNLAGQLKAINHPDLNTEAGRVAADRAGNDLFGMTLDYYTNDYLRNTERYTNTITEAADQYNGNIKAMTWNTDAGGKKGQLQYKYNYDRNNWLSEALFDGMGNQQHNAPETIILNRRISTTQENTASNSITFQSGFHVTSANSRTFIAKIVENSTNAIYKSEDYNVTNLEYDVNGNIKKLFRNKNTETFSTQERNEMDKLNYVYKTEKPNQLLRVEDAVTKDTHANDIKSQSGNNYIYNSIGQLITNEGEHVAYEYNASGLVTVVKYNGKKKVEFFYNDKNFRTKKITYQSDGVLPQKITDYVLDASGSALAIYEDGDLKELPIYGASRLGVYKKQANTSVYQLTDHVGNVRVVIAKQGNNAIALQATDYYPFGMAMPNRQIVNGEPYRYAYQGQEKDPETGKEAFQLRLWDARIGRWLTTDPAGQYNSPYMAMGNNPISQIDSDGAWSTKIGRFFAWLNYLGAGEFVNNPDAEDPNLRYGIKESGKDAYYDHNGWVRANLDPWDKEIIAEGLVDIDSENLGRDLSNVKRSQFNGILSDVTKEKIAPVYEVYGELRSFGGGLGGIGGGSKLFIREFEHLPFRQLQELVKNGGGLGKSVGSNVMNALFNGKLKVTFDNRRIVALYRELAYRIVHNTGGVPASKRSAKALESQGKRLNDLDKALRKFNIGF